MDKRKKAKLTGSEISAMRRDGFYPGISNLVSSNDMTGMVTTPEMGGMFNYEYMRPFMWESAEPGIDSETKR